MPTPLPNAESVLRDVLCRSGFELVEGADTLDNLVIGKAAQVVVTVVCIGKAEVVSVTVVACSADSGLAETTQGNIRLRIIEAAPIVHWSMINPDDA